MPIVEIRNPDNDADRRILIWSSCNDAPTTYGMTREEFFAYYPLRYGVDRAECELSERMALVDAVGTSEIGATTWLDTVTFNRAGPGETCLTPAELWAAYAYAPDGDGDDS